MSRTESPNPWGHLGGRSRGVGWGHSGRWPGGGIIRYTPLSPESGVSTYGRTSWGRGTGGREREKEVGEEEEEGGGEGSQ